MTNTIKGEDEMLAKIKRQLINMSLKRKWFSLTAATILVAYALVCFIIYIALYNWLLENEKNNAFRTADDLTGYIESQRAGFTIQELESQAGLMKAILNQEQTVRLYDLDGNEVLRINNFSPAVNIAEAISDNGLLKVQKREVDGIDTFVVYEMIKMGPYPFILQLIHPLSTFQSMMGYILTTMLIMGIGAVLFTAIISYYLSNALMSPIQQLRNSMQRVKENGFVERSDFSYSTQDEIGDLLYIYNEMLDELDRSFKRQQQFVFDASHEMRTPIQAIEGHLSLIKRWGKNDPEVLEESIDVSIEELGRMKKMMEELLQLARQEEDGVVEAVNVLPLLFELKREFEMRSDQIKVVIHSEREVLPIRITEQAFLQIARNFMENSVRYSEHFTNITITISSYENNISIQFADNGIGISEEHLPYIFDRFYRVDDARTSSNGGTGLGLSITKMLISKYNGEVKVQSEMGKGSIFCVKFPVYFA